jgi:hypothetical protein
MESTLFDLSTSENEELLSVQSLDPRVRRSQFEKVISQAVLRSFPDPPNDLFQIKCGPSVCALLQRGPSTDLATDNRLSDPSYILTRALFHLLVRRPTSQAFRERCGDFLVWITGEGCPAALACDVIGAFGNAWQVEPPTPDEALRHRASTTGPLPLADLGMLLADLSVARVRLEHPKILELLDGVNPAGPAEAQLEGYRWFALLAGGYRPLSPKLIESVVSLLTSQLMRSSTVARFMVINGVFLAPRSNDLSPELTGAALERMVTGFTRSVWFGQVWEGNLIQVDAPWDLTNPWEGSIGVIGYFYARAFRLQREFDAAIACVNAAFVGLSGPFAESLSQQLERERDAITLSHEFASIELSARRIREEVETTAENLRSENAQLIATFTGFFAFVFGALALFFQEQQVLTQGRTAGEVVLLNLAVLAPAGLVLGLLILLTRWVFRKPHHEKQPSPRRWHPRTRWMR